MSHDLTLPGTIPGLLRRCSPVAIVRDGGEVSAFGVVVDRPSDRVTWVRVLRDHDDEGPSPWDRDCVALDLTDATGRAHARWWLGERWPPNVMGDVEMLAGYIRLQHHERAGRRVGVRWGAWASGGWLSWVCGLSEDRAVPALANLDPDDDTRLPDGSRVVDAEALRRVVLHVAGVGHE